MKNLFFLGIFLVVYGIGLKVFSQDAIPVPGTLLSQQTPLTPEQAFKSCEAAVRIRDEMLANDEKLLRAANETISKQRDLLDRQHVLIVKLYREMGIDAP